MNPKHIKLWSVETRRVASLCSILLFLSGCTNDMKDISQFDRQDPPAQSLRDARVWRSEHGRLQMEMEAPLIVQYREPDTRTHSPP